MDDPHRKPRDSDRNALRDRVKRAMVAGRISSADGAIRLTNVASAQSMTELDLMTRDLDQLEATLQAGVPVPQPSTGATGGPGVDAVVTAATAGVRRTAPLLIVGLVIALVAAGAVGLFAFASFNFSSEESSGTLPEAPILTAGTSEASAVASPVVEPGEGPAEEPVEEPAGTPYALNAAGIKGFLATYRAKFGTTQVNDLTMYDDYVIVRVPVPGKSRHSGWIFRDGEFSDFGGVSANFPGSESVDTRKLDVAELVHNIATARRTLNVEEISTSYVNIDYRPASDAEPNVNIYMSNEFHEGGYLATTLDGRIERAYPYSG